VRAGRLDRLIHERLRLGIVTTLSREGPLSFVELRDRLGATDGNLAIHARKLEAAGYLVCAKRFEGRLPRTTFRLTASGRRALTRYLSEMQSLIRSARKR